VCLRSHFPFFLASASSTQSLQDDILTDCVQSESDFLQSYLAVWSAKFGNIPDALPTKQPFWDRPGVLEDKAQVEASLVLAYQLFANLGRKISSASDDDREGTFLFQRVSVLVQRYNAVLLHDTLPDTDCTDW